MNTKQPQYQSQIENWIRETDIGSIHAHSRSFFLAHPDSKQAATALVICFHGYTSGPWQFQPLAEHLQSLNYDIFVPRLPGHGTPSRDDLPSGPTSEPLTTFLSDLSQLISGASIPVYVIGLSVGGCLALRMAIDNPTIKTCVAMSPFFMPHNALAKVALKGLSYTLNSKISRQTSKKRLQPLLSRLAVPLGTDQDIPDQFFHYSKLSVDNILTLTTLGMETLQSLSNLAIPTLIIRSFSDTRSSQSAMASCIHLLKKTLNNRCQTLDFSKTEHVPHAMIHPAQNLNSRSIQTIHSQIIQLFSTKTN